MCIQAVPYELTEQGIFDYVYKFIVEQGEPSMDHGQCAYRTSTPEGKVLRCAAGCLISDDEAIKLDNFDIWYSQNSDSIPERLQPFAQLITSIQRCHDAAAAAAVLASPAFISKFQEHMHHTARFYGLTVPE